MWAPGHFSRCVLLGLTPALRPSTDPAHDPSLPSQSLSVGNVTTLLGQNMGDLQKAHSHPTISSWLCSLNRSALGELGLDTDPTGPTGLTHVTTRTPNTIPWMPHLVPTSDRPWSTDPSSGMPAPTLPTPAGHPRSALYAPPPPTATSFLSCAQSHSALAYSFHLPPRVTSG